MSLRRMLAVLSTALCLLVVWAVPSSASVNTTTAWRDDFNSLNLHTWNVVTWGCLAANNVSVSNGQLHLRLVATSSTRCPLVGGRIDTYGKRTFATGTYSARIQFSPRTGSGQTFWMTGASGRRFPSNGEIDIAEIIGRQPNVHHLRLHAAFASGVSGRCTQQSDLPVPPGYLSGWHTYSVTTTRSRTAVFRVDGVAVSAFVPNGICTWPFTDPMRAILSAGSGTWAGPPDKPLFPTTMSVDWFSYTPS